MQLLNYGQICPVNIVILTDIVQKWPDNVLCQAVIGSAATVFDKLVLRLHGYTIHMGMEHYSVAIPLLHLRVHPCYYKLVRHYFKLQR